MHPEDFVRDFRHVCGSRLEATAALLDLAALLPTREQQVALQLASQGAASPRPASESRLAADAMPRTEVAKAGGNAAQPGGATAPAGRRIASEQAPVAASADLEAAADSSLRKSAGTSAPGDRETALPAVDEMMDSSWMASFDSRCLLGQTVCMMQASFSLSSCRSWQIVKSQPSQRGYYRTLEPYSTHGDVGMSAGCDVAAGPQNPPVLARSSGAGQRRRRRAMQNQRTPRLARWCGCDRTCACTTAPSSRRPRRRRPPLAAQSRSHTCTRLRRMAMTSGQASRTGARVQMRNYRGVGALGAWPLAP